MSGDLLHGGLLKAAFQKDIERDIQQLLMALLLLLAGRPPDTRTLDGRICVTTNFLALLPKVLIMERTGTIITFSRWN